MAVIKNLKTLFRQAPLMSASCIVGLFMSHLVIKDLLVFLKDLKKKII